MRKRHIQSSKKVEQSQQAMMRRQDLDANCSGGGCGSKGMGAGAGVDSIVDYMLVRLEAGQLRQQ